MRFQLFTVRKQTPSGCTGASQSLYSLRTLVQSPANQHTQSALRNVYKQWMQCNVQRRGLTTNLYESKTSHSTQLHKAAGRTRSHRSTDQCRHSTNETQTITDKTESIELLLTRVFSPLPYVERVHWKWMILRGRDETEDSIPDGAVQPRIGNRRISSVGVELFKC